LREYRIGSPHRPCTLLDPLTNCLPRLLSGDLTLNRAGYCDGDSSLITKINVPHIIPNVHNEHQPTKVQKSVACRSRRIGSLPDLRGTLPRRSITKSSLSMNAVTIRPPTARPKLRECVSLAIARGSLVRGCGQRYALIHGRPATLHSSCNHGGSAWCMRQLQALPAPLHPPQAHRQDTPDAPRRDAPRPANGTGKGAFGDRVG